jgi:prevent-host-death family protein
MRSLSTAELRRRLAQVILEVAQSKRPVAIQRYRKPLVALVPIEMVPPPAPRARKPRSQTR